MPRSTTSILLTAATALTTLTVAAAPAVGNEVEDAVRGSASTVSCDIGAPLFEQPFAAFGDSRSYVLAPGGAFEPSTPGAWTLTGGAAIVEGNAPAQVRGPEDRMSLQIPSGGSAVSPTMCIDATYDTMRMFVRSLAQDGRPGGRLRVQAIYPDLGRSDDGRRSQRTVITDASADWTLSDDVPIAPRAGSVGGATRVAFVIDSKGRSGGHQIDDVFVDPRMGG